MLPACWVGGKSTPLSPLSPPLRPPFVVPRLLLLLLLLQGLGLVALLCRRGRCPFILPQGRAVARGALAEGGGGRGIPRTALRRHVAAWYYYVWSGEAGHGVNPHPTPPLHSTRPFRRVISRLTPSLVICTQVREPRGRGGQTVRFGTGAGLRDSAPRHATPRHATLRCSSCRAGHSTPPLWTGRAGPISC